MTTHHFLQITCCHPALFRACLLLESAPTPMARDSPTETVGSCMCIDGKITSGGWYACKRQARSIPVFRHVPKPERLPHNLNSIKPEYFNSFVRIVRKQVPGIRILPACFRFPLY